MDAVERCVAEFVTGASPQEVRSQLAARNVSPDDILAMYAVGSSHIAWFKKPAATDVKTPEPRTARKRKEAKHGSD